MLFLVVLANVKTPQNLVSAVHLSHLSKKGPLLIVQLTDSAAAAAAGVACLLQAHSATDTICGKSAYQAQAECVSCTSALNSAAAAAAVVLLLVVLANVINRTPCNPKYALCSPFPTKAPAQCAAQQSSQLCPVVYVWHPEWLDGSCRHSQLH
jgi:hypothetical protein